MSSSSQRLKEGKGNKRHPLKGNIHLKYLLIIIITLCVIYIGYTQYSYLTVASSYKLYEIINDRKTYPLIKINQSKTYSYNSDDFSFNLHSNGEHFLGSDEGEAKYYDNNDLNIPISFMYCSIAKVGSTFWFSVLSKFIKARGHSKHSILHLDSNKRNEILQNGAVFKFVFIRDPLERAFSAYTDKCAHIGKYSIKFCGDHQEETMSFMNFTLFIWNEYILNGVNDMNGHWIPQSFYCDLYKHIKVWNIYKLGNVQHTKWIFANLSLYDRYIEYASAWFNSSQSLRKVNVTDDDIWSLIPFTFKSRSINSSKKKRKGHEAIHQIYNLSILNVMLKIYYLDYIVFNLKMPQWICNIYNNQNMTHAQKLQKLDLTFTINTLIPKHLWPKCLHNEMLIMIDSANILY